MSTVLSNGVIVPDVGSTNWAADLETNWTLLNALIGAVGANVRLDRPNIWTAAQTFSEGIYGDLDGTAAMAVSDANGNEIATTYALKTDVTALANTLASKAADNSVVHLAGAETITGDKTWTGINKFTNPVRAVTSQSVPIAENPSAEIAGNNFKFIDNDRFWGQFIPVWSTDGSFRIELGISNWTTTGNQGYWTVGTEVSKDFSTLSFYTSHLNANLGTPTNKWKTLNGINPGALSLPRFSSGSAIAIDTTDWILNGTSYNPVKLNSTDTVMTQNGWLYVRASNTTAGDRIGIRLNGTTADRPTIILGEVGFGHIEGFVPVIAGYSVNIFLNKALTYCKFYPCQGNV